MKSSDKLYQRRTQEAFLYTRILGSPFYALFLMLPFILHKDLGASLLQITVITAIKPAASIFSMYWSKAINKRPDKIVVNLIWGRILSHFPFFLFPWISNPWFFIFSFGFYMTLHRGVIPAWMELLKLNIPVIKRERLFGFASIAGYLADLLFPFVIGWCMDGYEYAWRWLFPIAALISLSALFYQCRILVPQSNVIAIHENNTFIKQMISPWQDAWSLLSRRADFLRFVIGFMIGGGGIMILQPALPILFIDALHLSYTEVAMALTFCKGIGFVISTPFWTVFMNRVNIFRFNSLVIAIGCLFPIMLILAKVQISWIYTAYFFYGIMQAGSELGWNLSGPHFARQEDSSPYSSVNVLSVGIRGLIVPALGSLTCAWFGPEIVMLMGFCICLSGALRFLSFSKQPDFAY